MWRDGGESWRFMLGERSWSELGMGSMADEITPIEVKEDCLISIFGDLFLASEVSRLQFWAERSLQLSTSTRYSSDQSEEIYKN